MNRWLLVALKGAVLSGWAWLTPIEESSRSLDREEFVWSWPQDLDTQALSATTFRRSGHIPKSPSRKRTQKVGQWFEAGLKDSSGRSLPCVLEFMGSRPGGEKNPVVDMWRVWARGCATKDRLRVLHWKDLGRPLRTKGRPSRQAVLLHPSQGHSRRGKDGWRLKGSQGNLVAISLELSGQRLNVRAKKPEMTVLPFGALAQRSSFVGRLRREGQDPLEVRGTLQWVSDSIEEWGRLITIWNFKGEGVVSHPILRIEPSFEPSAIKIRGDRRLLEHFTRPDEADGFRVAGRGLGQEMGSSDQLETLDPSIRALEVEWECRSTRLRISDGRFGDMPPREVSVGRRRGVTWSAYADLIAVEDGLSLRLDLTVFWGLKTTPPSSLWPQAMVASSRDQLPTEADQGALSHRPLVGNWSGFDQTQQRCRTEILKGFESVKGVLDYGDYRLGENRWANLEYDPLAALIPFVVASEASERERQIVEAMIAHAATLDIIRSSRAEKGLPWKHGLEHQSGTFELGHVFIKGLLEAESLTLDPWLKEVNQEMAQALMTISRESHRYVNDRCYGWTLINLSALSKTGRYPQANSCLVELIDRLRRRQRADGLLALDSGGEPPSPEVNLWVHALTTMAGLRSAREVDERADEVRRSGLEAMAGHVRGEPIRVPRILRYARGQLQEPSVIGQSPLGQVGRLVVAAALLEGAVDFGSPRLLGKATALLDSLPKDGIRPRSPSEAIRLLHALERIKAAQSSGRR